MVIESKECVCVCARVLPPKACSVILRHRDSRRLLMSGSVTGSWRSARDTSDRHITEQQTITTYMQTQGLFPGSWKDNGCTLLSGVSVTQSQQNRRPFSSPGAKTVFCPATTNRWHGSVRVSPVMPCCTFGISNEYGQSCDWYSVTHSCFSMRLAYQKFRVMLTRVCVSTHICFSLTSYYMQLLQNFF